MRAIGFAIAVLALLLTSCESYHGSGATARQEPERRAHRIDMAQVPLWSEEALEFFLHGSMSTEIVPEALLQAFGATYPDLFPGKDLLSFGAIVERPGELPLGFSRREVPHLGGLSAVGMNCASCHTVEIAPKGGASVVVLGANGHFDAEAYFGAVTVAMLRTAEPENMRRFLKHYLVAIDPKAGDAALQLLDAALAEQRERISAAIKTDPSGAKDIAAGTLHPLRAANLRLDRKRLESGADLAALASSLLKLFHNIRVSLHIPDELPKELPPASGPGRNDPFGLLSRSLFGVATPYSPIKPGVTWNLENRTWVHADGNTRLPIIRNLLAALGLGAPLLGNEGKLDFAQVKRHTELTETMRAPRYPWAVDADPARRGANLYQTHCASCHEGPENDKRLYALEQVGTDPTRARAFDAQQAKLLNEFFEKVQIKGFHPPKEPAIRSTGKYWAAGLRGIWARSPYLHNASVRTMQELLTPPAQRAKSYRRGSRTYDTEAMGFIDEGHYVLDTTSPGNSNTGHDYGTRLSAAEKRDLIEFLKTQ